MSTYFNNQFPELPGYRLTERIETGGCGEVWRAEPPGGTAKAAKCVFGQYYKKRAEAELRSLLGMKAVRHLFLLSLERIEVERGDDRSSDVAVVESRCLDSVLLMTEINGLSPLHTSSAFVNGRRDFAESAARRPLSRRYGLDSVTRSTGNRRGGRGDRRHRSASFEPSRCFCLTPGPQDA